MKRKIDNPKIFISYAWGNQEYQEKVLSFATKLMQDGIDVIFDKWDLSEGNDTYAFMEKCVTDETITNVIMLLDPIYAQKADAHQGGVGTETQIISAQVYQKVTQDKFIPIVFERAENDDVCKPTYLQGRLHFDLSVSEKFESEYQRLVKTLYGEEVYPKPIKGTKPNWVTESFSSNLASVMSYNTMRANSPLKTKQNQFTSFLSSITTQILNFISQHNENYSYSDCISLADATRAIRSNYLQLLRNATDIENKAKFLASFFQETASELENRNGIVANISKILLHELFIYTIAWLYLGKEFEDIGYIFSKTYFSSRKNYEMNGASSYNLVYSGRYHAELDKAIRERDNKKYYSGTAQYWMDTVAIDFCSKEQLVFADLLWFNYSIYGKDYLDDWKWFPSTYVYEGDYNGLFNQFANRMISKDFVKGILPIFTYDSPENLIEAFSKIESDISKGRYRDYRYPGAFDSAPLISDYIKVEKIAAVK